MLTENQVLAALGEVIQLALSTAQKPGLICEARVSEGKIVIGVKDDGAVRYVNVMVEPVQESPVMPGEAEDPEESFVAPVPPSLPPSLPPSVPGDPARAGQDVPRRDAMTPAQTEDPSGPPDADPEGAPESTEAPGAAQDVRDTTEDTDDVAEDADDAAEDAAEE